MQAVAGDSQGMARSSFEHQAEGGSGGILGEEGKGGESGHEDDEPGNGGFGAGGGAADPISGLDHDPNDDILHSGKGGFGGGGGGAFLGYTMWGDGDDFGFGRGGDFEGAGGGGAGLGGAVFVRDKGQLFLDHCTFTGNSALGSTGLTAVEDGKGMGGAIFIMDNAYVLARDLSFSGNTAEDSGWNVSYADRSTPDVFGIIHDANGSTTAFPLSAASNWSIYR